MPAYRSRIGSVPFLPPAPVVELRVSDGSSVESVEALIDSGADATCIPEKVAERLELQPISVLLVGGAGVRAENRLVYRAHSLALEHISVDNFAVIGMPIHYCHRWARLDEPVPRTTRRARASLHDRVRFLSLA